MKIREKFCAWLFEISKEPYAYLFKAKKHGWELSSVKLLTYPEGTLGKKVGEFLKHNKFELLYKLENHDVHHVITGMSTSVKDEIGMQFLMMGNGRKSMYLFTTVAMGLFLLPEYSRYYISCYRKGKLFDPIYKLDLKQELNNQLSDIRENLKKEQPKHVRLYEHVSDHF